MAFKLVYYAQNDPKWKDDILGFSNSGETLEKVGCALTSVAMFLSGFGNEETPKSLNQKLKDKKGFYSSSIVWGAVSQIYPQVKLVKNLKCENIDAPLGEINAALDTGRPVIVRVDATSRPDFQWHYVLVYARNGDDDYLMLDPWPYKPGVDKQDSLMKRYSQGMPLRRAIQHVIIYDAPVAGGPISIPGSTTTDTTTPPTQPAPSPAPAEGVHARVMDSVTWGLNIRSSRETSSTANIITAVPAGTQLLLLDPNEVAKLGLTGQWVRVREPGGKDGFAAAQYLEKVGGSSPAPVPEPAPAPANEPPASNPIPVPSTPEPPPASGKLTLVVSDAVGTGGLRLRKTPSMGGDLLMVLKARTRLIVTEPEGKAKAKIGKANQWIQVREPGGRRGYVAAAYVTMA